MSIINMFVASLILAMLSDIYGDLYDYEKPVRSRKKRRRKHKYLRN